MDLESSEAAVVRYQIAVLDRGEARNLSALSERRDDSSNVEGRPALALGVTCAVVRLFWDSLGIVWLNVTGTLATQWISFVLGRRSPASLDLIVRRHFTRWYLTKNTWSITSCKEIQPIFASGFVAYGFSSCSS
jgi:hypothetical protein